MTFRQFANILEHWVDKVVTQSCFLSIPLIIILIALLIYVNSDVYAGRIPDKVIYIIMFVCLAPYVVYVVVGFLFLIIPIIYSFIKHPINGIKFILYAFIYSLAALLFYLCMLNGVANFLSPPD